MNQNSLKQIFQQYIDNFEYINTEGRNEYYKWQVCHEFPSLMKKALSANDDEFRRVLYQARKSTYNIIDSYTQPFAGLVEFAGKDPQKVRHILMDLYADDGGDIKIQMEKISDFFKRCDALSGDSFLYKQNSHSVSALLFLMDPDHHYMYKATQSKNFADCVEFYDDWGTGDNIKLDVYYRMCDELVAEIKDCKELLDTDAGRYDGRLNITGGELHQDNEKHILAFDIIYCSTVYNLYGGISYSKRNLKEKQVFMAEKTKAEALKQSYDKANADKDALDDALRLFVDMISVGDQVEHTMQGKGTVTHINESQIAVDFSGEEKRYGLPFVLSNEIITLDKASFSNALTKYKDVLKRYDSIPRALEAASRALKSYEEYLN